MRMFVGIGITGHGVTQSIRKFQNDMLQINRATPVRPENLHFTLQFLGEIPESESSAVLRAVESVKFESFEVRLSGVGAFPNRGLPRAVWVGTDKAGGIMLTKLASDVSQTLKPLGLVPDKPFKPHLTVLRIRNNVKKNNDNTSHDAGRSNANTAKDTIIKRLAKYKTSEFGVQMITTIKLKKSDLRPGGPTYSDIAYSIQSNEPRRQSL